MMNLEASSILCAQSRCSCGFGWELGNIGLTAPMRVTRLLYHSKDSAGVNTGEEF
jgi:hypothetical protein